MFEVSVKQHFSAAHHLRGYAGQCADLHGHNWEVEVALRGRTLNRTGILVDFRLVKDSVRDTLRELDHTDLNTHKAFTSANPTSENIARFLYRELGRRLNSRRCRIVRVSVRETPDNTASYSE